MNTGSDQPRVRLEVFYDGACHLCSREIAQYRRRDRAGAVRWIDIAQPGFDAARYGLDPERVQAVMHVRSFEDPEHPQVFTAVEAFLEIWRVLPGYGRLATLVKFPLLRPLVRGGYLIFARVRRWLPKRRVADSCATDTCRPGFRDGR